MLQCSYVENKILVAQLFSMLNIFEYVICVN